MSTFESEAVEIATLKARNAQFLLTLADVDHLIRLHALHGLADALESVASLQERLNGPAFENERATLAVLAAKLADVERHLTERQCSCSRTDRVALELADEPEPGKVVPLRRPDGVVHLRKVAIVRKPGVRDLFRDVIAKLTSPPPCARTSADEYQAAHGIDPDEDGAA